MNRRFAIMVLCMAGLLVGFAAQEIGSQTRRDEVDYGPVIQRLTKMVQVELDRGFISGVSIALVDDKQIVLADGFGFADKQERRPATSETIYRVGSLSKLFTALSAMQLVEQGKLDIDAPITEALPEFKIETPFAGAGPITLRQMMCHRSGMVRESPVGGYFDGSEPTVMETIASLETCVLVNPPNTKTRYSNVGPTIVGQTVAAVSGQTFEAYQQQHLLEPLKMQHSAWRMNDRLRKQLAASYMRVADGQGGFSHRRSPEFELGTLPAGNLYSTVADMAQFAKMLLAEGQTESGRVIQAATLREMSTPQLTEETTGFGVGFYVGSFAGQGTIQHSGAVYGFSSSLVVLPDAGIAAIVLANEDIAMGPVRRLSDAALLLMLEAKAGQAPDPTPEPLELTAEQLQAFVGEYESESSWAEITVLDGRVQANISGQSMELTPIEPLKFEANGQFSHRSIFNFHGGDSCCMDGFTALGQRFTRVDPDGTQEIPAGWHKYLGSYGPKYIPLVISARHGHLYAMTENMVDYRLTPVNQFVFRMPEGLYADEFIVFQVDNEGRVLSVNLANMALPRKASRNTRG